MRKSNLYAGAAFPKNPPKRDPKLRAWIAQQWCLIWILTGKACAMKTHAAHVPNGSGGTAMKGDDLFVPLCAAHHSEQHTKGLRTFERKYRVDLLAEASRYRLEYEAE